MSDTSLSREGDPIPDEAVEAFVNSGPSSGAYSDSEDWVRENSRKSQNDGRSPTRTTFYASDAEQFGPGQKHRDPEDRRSWGTLAKWQDGVGSDISRGSQNWWADKQRWAETFGDVMGASGYHIQRTKQILEEIDMTPYRSARTSTEVLIVGILSLLVDSDINDFDNRALNRDGTQDLLDALGATVTDYENTRKLLRKRDKDLLFPNR